MRFKDTLVSLAGDNNVVARSVVVSSVIMKLVFIFKVGFHYPSSRPEFTGRVDGP